MWQQRILHLTAGLLLAALVLTGCDESPQAEEIVVTEVVTVAGEPIEVTRVVRREVEVVITTTPPPPDQVPDPVNLDIALVGSPGDLDPQRALEASPRTLVQNLFTRLTRLDPVNNVVVPELATAWSVSADGLTWTFNLRDDIYWLQPSAEDPDTVSLFRPVDAGDVVFAVQRACDARTATPDIFMLYVVVGCEELHRLPAPTNADRARVGVSAPDPQTVVFTLRQPADYLLTLTATSMLTPLPPEQFDLYGAAWADPENLVTSGPFMRSPRSLSSGRVVLLRNPAWPLPFSGNVDVVNLFFLSGRANAFALWEDRQVDLSPLPAAAEAEMRLNSPERLRLLPTQELFYVAFDFDNGAFREPEVRRALNAAIDRQRLIDEVELGRGLPMRHLAPAGTVGAPPPDQVGVGYDPDFARQQLLDSSFNSCRLLPPVTLMTTSSDRALQQAELLRDMWELELDCNEEQFEIRQVQFGELLVYTRPGERERPALWDLGWAPYFPDSHNWLYDLLHCNSGENRMNRPCGAVDTLLAGAVNLGGDQEARAAAYRSAEQQLFGREGIQPLIPLYVRADPVVQHTWLLFEPNPFGGEQFDTYVVQWEAKQLERSLE